MTSTNGTRVSNENNANLVWAIANLLRGPYRPAQYGEVILPFTVLRRLDCVLEATKPAVLAEYEIKKDGKFPLAVLLPRVSGHAFYNTSRYSLTNLGDADHIKSNLLDYVQGFSDNVRDIFERFGFQQIISELDEEGLLLLVTKRFAAVDLHPELISNIEMGLMFEELIRKFAESSNDTAGDHYTPREVIKLMVELLFAPDDDILSKPGVRRSIYDPTAGTGGMLSVADEHLRSLNPDARLAMFGQERNKASYALCKADIVIKGQSIDAIVLDDTLTDDGHRGRHFNYCLSNPPFGVEWCKAEKVVREEHEQLGFDGRFGRGCPRSATGQCSSCCTLSARCVPLRTGAVEQPSCSTADRCSPGRPARATPRSGAGSSSRTCLRLSSRCRRTCSTTPASRPTSGCSATGRRSIAAARSSSSTHNSSM